MTNLPDPEIIRNAGIAPSLVNYLHFFGAGECKEDCLIHDLCTEAKKRVKMGQVIKGLVILYYCPMNVLYLEGDDDLFLRNDDHEDT